MAMTKQHKKFVFALSPHLADSEVQAGFSGPDGHLTAAAI